MIFKDIQYSSITEICAELAKFADKSTDSSNLPKLELFLVGGNIITGKIVNFQKNNSQSHIWVSTSNDDTVKQAVFVPVHNLAGISILDLDEFLFHRETNNPLQNIGSLELKRRKLETENQLSDIMEKNIAIEIDNFETINEMERANTNRILEQLPSLFKSILSDTLGKKLMNDAVNSIQLVFSDSEPSELKNGVLVIPVKEKRTHLITKEMELLKSEIEALI